VPPGRQRSSKHPAERFRIDVHADEAAFLAMLADDVRRARLARVNSPKYFYDTSSVSSDAS
jgi:hypothetical protein